MKSLLNYLDYQMMNGSLHFKQQSGELKIVLNGRLSLEAVKQMEMLLKARIEERWESAATRTGSSAKTSAVHGSDRPGFYIPIWNIILNYIKTYRGNLGQKENNITTTTSEDKSVIQQHKRT